MIFVLFLTGSMNAVINYPTQPLPHVVVNFNRVYRNIVLTQGEVYFVNGTAYDFYSIDELNGRSKPGLQWKTFPLPNEDLPANMTPWTPHNDKRKKKIFVGIPTYPEPGTGLAFVDHIYIAGSPNLTDRRANLKRLMKEYQIANYEWREKWSPTNCYSVQNREEIFRKLNLYTKFKLTRRTQRRCAITMEHIDIWHDIIKRNSSLSLILEDDAVFVPNFREKFDRTIYTAIHTGALKIQGLTNCINKSILLPESKEGWFEQDPMIFVGGCLYKHDRTFEKNRKDAQPILSTHKTTATRCTHAYLLTACSAQALLRQIAVKINVFLQIDYLLDVIVDEAPTLQSFWLDPPIVYQGNHIADLDGIPSFHRTVY
ncbi:unnamed protein product [Rotaria sp. Silwood2]|nr:unnamed protein product [Rotaria sp. Silwood2]